MPCNLILVPLIQMVSPSMMRTMPVTSAIATDIGNIKTRVRTRSDIQEC